jgi:hypothetical protein
MATPPIVCDTIQFEGAIFQRCNLQVIKGTTVIREISLCDTDIVLNNYSSFSGCVYGNSSLLLNSENSEELSFIMIKATYPTSLPISNRFINILYKGKYLPMSNLTILTGNPSDTSPYILNRGWDLDPNGSDIFSPYFENGGMILYNPHSVRVNIDVILGSNI